jgi:GlcNAc-P-P-Und epimerase
MNKVTVIGGSGFIGSVLINELKTHDYAITNIDKAPSPVLSGSLTGDVRITETLGSGLYNDTQWVVLLAAEHKDNVAPVSLYYDVNVQGTANVLAEMEKKGIQRIIFTSSVAVYGLNKENPDETHNVDPFNDYGKSKWEAEELLRKWYNKDPENRTLVIIRPTVVFGPGNKGNVYNLLKQITTGRFMMVGNGRNVKSMAYVENVVGFIRYCINGKLGSGYHLFNYADKPDLSTNELISQIEQATGRKVSSIRIPYGIGLLGGYTLDVFAKIFRKQFPISAVRVKKFCATTQFSAAKVANTGYRQVLPLTEGLNKTIHSIEKEN